jgi:hypothetical protein
MVRIRQQEFLSFYEILRKLLTFFGVITMSLTLATIGLAIACTANFRKGLKPHVASSRLARALEEDYQMQRLTESEHRDEPTMA